MSAATQNSYACSARPALGPWLYIGIITTTSTPLTASPFRQRMIMAMAIAMDMITTTITYLMSPADG
jgi:hypothetical protein